MKSINQEVNIALRLSNKDIEKYAKYSNIYPWTNEELQGAFEPFCKAGSKVLTCNGSGDHPLNAVLYGSKDITAFDINKLSLYYLDLKIAAILSFSREEFLNCMPGIFDDKEFVLHALKRDMGELELMLQQEQKEKGKYKQDLFTSQELLQNLKNISKASYEFWTRLYTKKNDVMDSFLFKIDACGPKKEIVFCSNYLNSDENYNIVKSNLPHINIKKENTNIKNLPRRLKGEQYDFIHLSNIANSFNEMTWPYRTTIGNGIKIYSQFVKNNIYQLLKEGGTIILNRLQDPYRDLMSIRIDYSMQRAFNEANMNLEILDLESKERVYYKKR